VVCICEWCFSNAIVAIIAQKTKGKKNEEKYEKGESVYPLLINGNTPKSNDTN
jgi:hypothetical protein